MRPRRETHRLVLIAVLALLLPVLAAVPLMAQTEDSPDGVIAVDTTAASDSAIRTRITDILAELDGYDDVRVTVDSGIVTLDGQALDGAAVDRLDRLVSRVDGVVEIQNRVRETTELGARLRPVAERFVDRLFQFAAFVPLLLVAVLAGGVIYWLGSRLARLEQPWNRIAPNPFIAEILRTAIRLAFALASVVVALDILGATALLGTFLGAAGIIGIALGFAVRDTVENFIASVMLSLRQPFRPNDLVDIDGKQGRVIKLSSRATTLLSLDGNHIRIPNGAVFKAVITNYTRNAERRFSFDLGVDAGSDLAAVRQLGLETLRGLDFVLTTPEPAVWVAEVGDSNVLMRFTGWVTQQGAEFNKARGEAIRVIKETLESAGYGLPEPIYRIRVDDMPEDSPRADDLLVTLKEAGDAAAAATTRAPRPRAAPADAGGTPACDSTELAPDHGFERMVAESRHSAAVDGERNLLSPDAPQE